MQAFIIALALKATVLVALAALIVQFLKRQSAATRHLVWTLCFAAIVAAPVLSAVLPAWHVPGLPGFAQPSIGFEVEQQAAESPAVETAAVAGGSGRLQAVGDDPEQGSTTARDRLQPPVTAHPIAGTSSEAAPVRFAVRPHWTVWLPVVWLAGAMIVLAAILTGLARTTWLARRAGVTGGARVRRVAHQAVRRLGIRRRVRVVVAEDQLMPMTWGARRPVVLLPSEAEQWSDERLWAVLLHELAHVKRHDFTTQLVARLACALCWFHPLVWLAARQLRIERELACDDLVLRSGSRPSEYAQQLLDIARSLKAQPLTAVASVAMARPSQLAGRLLAVLDAERSRAGVTRGVVIAAVVLAAVVVVPVAGASPWGEAQDERSERASEAVETEAVPGGSRRSQAVDASATARNRLEPPATAQQCSWLTGEHTSASTNINDDRTRIRIEIDGCRIDVSVDGDVRFTDDFTDVARLTSGGRLEIEERAGRDRRRIEITPGGGGLTRRWWVDGDERAYDDEARAWLSRTLTVVFRRTGFHAKERADWIFRTRGLQGLLAEIDSIYSDYAAGRYYQVVLAQPNLDGTTVSNLVRQAGARIDSDHTLGQLLMAVAEHQAVDENVRAAYVAAAQSIDSDFTKRQVLSAILKRPGLSPEVAAAMLQQATQMDSDHEIGTLLRELIEAHPIDQSMTPAFFQAVNGIDSDFTRRSVLEALLEKGAPSQDVLDRTLEATSGMDSDHEVGRVLRSVLETHGVPAAARPAFFRAVGRLDSDFERGRVLRAVIDRKPADRATVLAAVEAGKGIDSDHELGRFIMHVTDNVQLDDELRSALRSAADAIESEHTRGQVLSRLYPRTSQ